MLGIALIAVGAILLWAAFTGRGGAVLNALNMNLPAAGNTASTGSASGGGGGGGGGSGGSGTTADSGTHQGIDATGNVYTISSSYGSMTDTQKDDANRYAHTIGNVG
jgi:hypothetical protein